MDPKERYWFDCAYGFCDGFLNISLLIHGFSGDPEDERLFTEHYGKIFKNDFDEFVRRLNVFRSKVPSVQAFREEKERLYPSIALQLQRMFPDLEGVIAFGSTRGDIDLAPVGKTDLRNKKRQLDRFYRTYPIVDNTSLDNFSVSNGGEFTRRLINLREGYVDEFDEFELTYLQLTISSARMLYGNPRILQDAKGEFVRYLLSE